MRSPARYAAATVSAGCVLLTATRVTSPARPARALGRRDPLLHACDVLAQRLLVHVRLRSITDDGSSHHACTIIKAPKCPVRPLPPR